MFSIHVADQKIINRHVHQIQQQGTRIIWRLMTDLEIVQLFILIITYQTNLSDQPYCNSLDQLPISSFSLCCKIVAMDVCSSALNLFIILFPTFSITRLTINLT